jgi:hypothetical protein
MRKLKDASTCRDLSFQTFSKKCQTWMFHCSSPIKTVEIQNLNTEKRQSLPLNKKEMLESKISLLKKQMKMDFFSN